MKFLNYILSVILISLFLFFISCAESFSSRIKIKNKTGYTITDLSLGEESFHNLDPLESTISKSFNPGTYRLRGLIDTPDPTEINRDVRVNVMRVIIIKIRMDGDKVKLLINDTASNYDED